MTVKERLEELYDRYPQSKELIKDIYQQGGDDVVGFTTKWLRENIGANVAIDYHKFLRDLW